jgi:hypothetical protein
MKTREYSAVPIDAKDRVNVKPTICYSLKVSIWSAPQALLKDLTCSKISSYSKYHGLISL